MSKHQWLAAIIASPSGAVGFYEVFNGEPWTGVLLLCFAQFIYYMVMGHDLDKDE